MVEVSTQVLPGAMPASAPFSPIMFSRTCSGSGRQVMTMWLPVAASLGESAQTAPAATTESAVDLNLS
ncbi:hypothetical protein D3C78_1859530 [compost metagenome]